MAIHKKIGRWFNVHENEIGLFMWTVALLFLVRSSGIFLNNYAETAFLKRYGVEYMPVVNMINAVVTFFVMGVMTGFMTRLPGARLLSRLFIFCALSVAGIRVIIPFGIDLIYPALFMLKSQYEVLLALLFWNLANDLFNTRQSKRLFPLITAGGVIGQILGSFATPLVARWLYLDNLLVIYVVTALAGAWVVRSMGRRYPTLLFQQKKEGEKQKRTSMIEEFKTVLPLIKSSVLVKILVVLTFMPNVVIPIMNYQFNFAVNEQFATESGLIEFFGYFRGVLNIVSLVILLFVGKLYDRFGLPVALMFHPFNYVIVFITFLFRFDAVAAMYARMSANIIRTTINIPATAVVTGLFPESYRAMIRPFLRGTVVRIGLFLGSGLILLSDALMFHPRYLSLVALPFVLVWVVTPFILKRRYAGILLDLVSDKRIDFRSLDANEIGQVFRDKKTQQGLIQRFRNTAGEGRLWYGRLLGALSVPDLDAHLLAALQEEQHVQTRIGLIELLSDQAGSAAVKTFNGLIDTGEPELIVSMIDNGHRISAEAFAPFNRRIYESSLPMDIKGRAAGSLYTVDPERFGPVIDAWLTSDDTGSLCAGIIAAGVCRDSRFAERLKTLLSTSDDATLLLVLDSLRAIDVRGLNPLVVSRLFDSNARMRCAVLEVYQIEDEASLKNVIPLLGDDSGDVAELAREKIRTAGYQNSLRLVKSLSLPQKKLREALFGLLADMAIKDLDVFRFVQLQALACYQLMIQARGIRKLPEGTVRDLLAGHLDERVWFNLQTTLRVLAAQDPSGRMHMIARSIFSPDKRKRANSLEAMDDILDNSLVRILAPLFDDMDISERIEAGRRLFPSELPEPTVSVLIGDLLVSRNWVTLVLTLTLLRQMALSPDDTHPIKDLAEHKNSHVSLAATELLKKMPESPSGQEAAMKTAATIPLTDKILHLKTIEIFADLSVNELAAVASVTEEASFGEGEMVFREGETGDTLFLIVEGEVGVIKDCNADKEIELDSIGPGDYFGEMALFGDDRRSATSRVKKDARFLTLHKQELQEIVREYPQIALHVCRVLSVRIRRLHGKISDQSC